MRFQGKITKWFDDKGYGFITSDQGESVFLHFSAFKSTGLHANIGDRVSYKIAKGDKGLQAYDLEFLDKIKTSNRTFRSSSKNTGTNKVFFILAAVLIVLAVTQLSPERLAFSPTISNWSEDSEVRPLEMDFQCLGKTRCNEMVSCDEATFYLQNCPGSISDGDGDGIPCEDQWCG